MMFCDDEVGGGRDLNGWFWGFELWVVEVGVTVEIIPKAVGEGRSRRVGGEGLDLRCS